MDQMIDRLTTAFADYDAASVHVPARNGFNYDQPKPGLVEWMPVMVRNRHALMKLVSYHPSNPDDAGLPTILSSLSLIDITTGHMVAMADGTFLTALRTGAASAIATRLLADPNAKSVGLIGCGAQAVTQIHALSRVMPIELVLFWDKDSATRRSFTTRVTDLLPASTRYRETPLELIVPNVDVLCTATSISVGQGPLFEGDSVKEALHINAVGSDFPGKVEIPKTLLEKSTVIADFNEQAIVEGECQQLHPNQIGAELYSVLQDESYRDLRKLITVFDSTGWALEDLVAMELLVDWSEEFGLGREARFECIPLDPKNPYQLCAVLADASLYQK